MPRRKPVASNNKLKKRRRRTKRKPKPWLRKLGRGKNSKRVRKPRRRPRRKRKRDRRRKKPVDAKKKPVKRLPPQSQKHKRPSDKAPTPPKPSRPKARLQLRRPSLPCPAWNRPRANPKNSVCRSCSRPTRKTRSRPRNTTGLARRS